MLLTDSMISALIGGVVGAAAAIACTWYSKNSERKEKLAEMKYKKLALCVLLTSEITAIRESYSSVRDILNQTKAGEYFDVIYPIKEEYFIIYHANAARLSWLCDNNLQFDLVKLYIKMKSLADSFRVNNELIAEYEAQLKMRMSNIMNDENITHLRTRDLLKARLIKYCESLKTMDSELTELGGIVLLKLNKITS